jgi:hypothetical protein
MVWHGTVLYDQVWCLGQDDSLYYSIISSDTAWYGTESIVWYKMTVWYAMAWYGVIWYGMIWYGIVGYGGVS